MGQMMASMSDFLKKVATAAGRGIEFLLTGQTSFAIITSEFQDFERVTDLVKARRVLQEARTALETRFGIIVSRPVLLDLFDESGWSKAGVYRMLHGTLGHYQQQALGDTWAHGIRVVKGLPRGRFKAIVAHEMVHAWERESEILKTDRALREGFARWVEYKVLQSEGLHAEAARVARIRTWRYGRGIRTLLAVEKRCGEQGVLDFVRRVA